MRKLANGDRCLVPPATASLRQRLELEWRTVTRTGRLMIGVPEYDTYVAHCRIHHPDQKPMTYEEFFRNRLAARYGGGGRSGCC